MAAIFDVERVEHLEERGLFAVAGTVREGTPRIGMTAKLEGTDGFERQVHGIEMLKAGEAGEPALPCLTFHCKDSERARSWMALDWEGGTLELSF